MQSLIIIAIILLHRARRSKVENGPRIELIALSSVLASSDFNNAVTGNVFMMHEIYTFSAVIIIVIYFSCMFHRADVLYFYQPR